MRRRGFLSGACLGGSLSLALAARCNGSHQAHSKSYLTGLNVWVLRLNAPCREVERCRAQVVATIHTGRWLLDRVSCCRWS